MPTEAELDAALKAITIQAVRPNSTWTSIAKVALEAAEQVRRDRYYGRNQSRNPEKAKGPT